MRSSSLRAFSAFDLLVLATSFCRAKFHHSHAVTSCAGETADRRCGAPLRGEELVAARQLAARMAAERYGNKTMGHDIRPLLGGAEEGLRGAASQKARTAAFLRPRSLAYAVRTRRSRRSFQGAE